MALLEATDTGRGFCGFLKNELKNLTNVVMGKLYKLVHKQNCFTYWIDVKRNCRGIIVESGDKYHQTTQKQQQPINRSIYHITLKNINNQSLIIENQRVSK